MKLKHILLALFVVLLCVVAINTAEEASALTTPSLSWESVSYNASNYVHTIKFTITSDGSRHFIKVVRKDGQYEHTYETTEKTLTWTPSWAGEYYAFVTSHGDGTYLSSSSIDIYVGRPYNITITGDANVVAKGQTINLTYSSSDKNATYYLHIKNASTGNDVESFPGTKNTTYAYSTQNLSPGNYYAQLHASNGTGGESSDHKYWFTVVGGSASASLTNTDNLTNGTLVHGNLNYSFTISTTVNGTVNNANFKVTATYGSEIITLYSVSNGKVNSIHASVSSPSIGLNTSFGDIGSNGNKTVTFKLNTSHADFDRGVEYSVQVQAGTVDLTGLVRGNGTDVGFSASNSHKFKTTSGSLTLTINTKPSGTVQGTVSYKITVKNDTNHSVNAIGFKLGNSSVNILTIKDGAKASGDATSVNITGLSNKALASGSSMVVTFNYNASLLTGLGEYTFDVSGSTATGNGIVGTRTLSFNGGSHSYKVGNGTVTTTVTGQPTTNGKIVYGNIAYTIKIYNGTNYDIQNLNFKFGSSAVNILTVANSARSSGVSATITGLNSDNKTLAAGKTMTITFTYNTANLTSKDLYTFQVLNTSSDGIGFSVGDINPTFDGGSHNYYVANGTLSVTVTQKNPGTNGAAISNGAIAAGNVVYTVSIKNNTNHQVNNVNVVVKIGSSTLVTIKNGAVNGTNHGSVVSVDSIANIATIDANATKSFTITVNASHSSLSRDTKYIVCTAAGTCSASNLTAGSKTGVVINASDSTVPHIKTNKPDVSISWAPSIDSGKVVEGIYKYVITFTNTSNHAIKGIDFILSEGNTPLVTVTDGAVTVNAPSYVSVDKSTLGDANKVLAVNGTVTLEVTIDTTKLSDGSSHTYTLSDATCNANGIQGGSSTYLLTANAGYTHSFTVREGDISVDLKVESVINSGSPVTMVNGGVAEDKVVYTITLTNDTNHNLKNIVIILKDNGGNALITFSGGALTKNSDLVTNTGTVTVNGKVTTISGITVNAKDASLDSAGQLIVHVESDATSSDVVGSGENYAYDADTGAFTIMVRHDVNVLVQAGKDTTITADVIRKAMRKSAATAYNNIPETITGVKITDINGNEITNAKISVDGTGLKFSGLTAEYTEFIIEVSYDGGKILVPMQVTTLASGQDRVFVLNYSLPVTVPVSELLADLRSTGGAYASTTFAAIGFDNDFIDEAVAPFTGTFGNFDLTAENVVYTNARIMTDGDAVYLVIRVTDGNGEVENVDYVDLYKQITIIPGNVVYYEDNNGGIYYPPVNDIVILGEVNQVSTSVSLPLIPGDNTFNDGAYKDDVEYSGLGVHKVPVKDQQVTVTFTFTGTGFELLSRVNAFDAATILVKVSPAGQNNWTWYPVITKFNPTGAEDSKVEVYQVPVFRLNNGEYGTYDVEVVGLPLANGDEYNDDGTPKNGYIINYIYIDGIRVYNPLGTSDLTNNYGDEKDAEFTNLRDLILNGQGLVTKYEDGKLSGFTSGNFYYVPDDKGNFTAAMGGINELGAIGANNEILIRKSEGDNMIVLYVKGDGLLQIGIHDVHDDKFDGGNGNNVPTTVKILNVVNDNNEWVDLATGIQHGAELYYNIDLNNCPEENGNKVVMLRVESGFASFTNVKHKGVTFESIGTPALDAYVNPGYYFNANGDMCFINEDGEEEVKIPAAELANMGVVTSMLAETEPEEEII